MTQYKLRPMTSDDDYVDVAREFDGEFADVLQELLRSKIDIYEDYDLRREAAAFYKILLMKWIKAPEIQNEILSSKLQLSEEDIDIYLCEFQED